MENPLIKEAAVSLESEIPSGKIVARYQRKFNLDVSSYFKGIDSVKIYRCSQSGYRFYYPFSLAGNSEFYEHLQQFEWYYNPWKWEHQICADLIQPGQSILEVGSGQVGFLKNLRKLKDVKCTGLELNKSVQSPGNGIEIRHEFIEDFAKDHKEQFDVVCSFQVLEHISQVHSFLQGKIDCLKKGGLMVISVPNNDAFIKYDKNAVLNMPPHHMGLWEERSLRSLEDIFRMKCREVLFEPLQPYHYEWYTSLMAGKYLGYYPGLIWGKLLFTFFKGPMTSSFDKKAAQIPGHTITVIYEKQ